MPLSKSIKSPLKIPMTDAQLAKWEASRDLEAELLESVRQMKRGEGKVVHSPVIAARQRLSWWWAWASAAAPVGGSAESCLSAPAP